MHNLHFVDGDHHSMYMLIHTYTHSFVTRSLPTNGVIKKVAINLQKKCSIDGTVLRDVFRWSESIPTQSCTIPLVDFVLKLQTQKTSVVYCRLVRLYHQRLNRRHFIALANMVDSVGQVWKAIGSISCMCTLKG